MGVNFDPQWVERLKSILEGEQRARAEHRATKASAETLTGGDEDSDENFAFIAGYTAGGYPYGVTWEEWRILEQRERADRESDPF